MRRICSIVLLLTACSAFADDNLINADRPGIADGSTTVGASTFQLETGIDHDRDGNAFPTLLRYGLGDAFELRVEGEDALAHPTFGFKWHFLSARSLGLIVRAGQEHQGDVRLAADFNVDKAGKWSLNPNVGFDRDRNALAALTVQYNVTDRANVFVDGGYDAGQLLLDAGGAVILGRDTQLDVSITRGVRGTPNASTTVSAGISRRF